MKIGALLLAFSIGVVPAVARAASQPVYAPPDSWVRAVQAGEVAQEDSARPSQIILLNEQDRFQQDGRDSFTQIVTAIQTSEGLSTGASVQFGWDPDSETPVIHSVLIRRGGKTIDVLAQGQAFTILRRENNLQDDVLDGRLTAVLEPEGLRVGDVVDFAYTIRKRDPMLRGHAESITRGPLRSHASRLFLRALWPADHPMKWSETEGLDKPVVSASKDGTELVIDMRGVEQPAAPEGAPPRYRQAGQLTLTDFSKWDDLTGLFGPLYAQAATLAKDSAVRVEAARIGAQSADPRARASAALRLVQEQVRYVFLAMNGGGYRPAPAEVTWQRRFGDCKGKTVLLLALLRELGIEAVPVLVSTDEGDGLDARLPAAGWFDHAIVRASIDGRVYWLDGTRTGDTNIDALQVPPYDWVLPLRAPSAGGQTAGLARLEQVPLAAPDAVTSIALDTTHGLFAPARAAITIVMRGDLARGFKAHAESRPYSDLRAELKSQMHRQYGLCNMQKLDVGFNESSGEEEVFADGEINLEVGARDAERGRTIRIGNSAVDRAALFDRSDGPHDDAPFALPMPDFNTLTITITLPAEGAGMSVAGQDFDRSLAGLSLKRSVKLQGGRLTISTSVKTLAEEIPASVARDAMPELAALARDSVTLHMPAAYRWSNEDYAARSKLRLSNPDDLLERGLRHIGRGDYAMAIDDLSAVLSKAPNAAASANRGIAYIWLHDQLHANADFERAAQLDPHNGAMWKGRGIEALHAHQDEDAITDFTYALQADPNDAPALGNRGVAERRLKHYDAALADFAAALRVEPNWTSVATDRWDVLCQQNKADVALGEAEAWTDAHPGDARAHLGRARVLWALKRKAEARAAVDASIAIEPAAVTFLTRARMIDPDDAPLRLQALDRAVAIDPHLAAAQHFRGYVLLLMKQYDEAIKAFGLAVADAPDDDDAIHGRALAYQASGKRDLALEDFSTLIARHKDNADYLNTRCWFRATGGKMLQEALADCDAALKLKPDSAQVLDSRGFVRLRLGQYDGAIEDYNAALRLRPLQPTSLLGRSIAERRRGEQGAAEKDLAAARGIDPKVEAEFAGYGLARG